MAFHHRHSRSGKRTRFGRQSSRAEAAAALRQALDARVNIEGWSHLPEFVRKEAMEKAISTSRAQAHKATTLTPDFMQRKLEAMQKDLDRKAGQITAPTR